MSIIREFTLYLHAGITTPKVIHANQYSQGETWIFKLLQDDGSVYVPSTGALIGVKADGHAIAGLTGTVLGDGRVSITTTQQLTAAAGDATCELTIDGGTNGSANFVIRVEKKPTDDAILSESDLSIIQEGLNSVTPAAINESVSNYLAEHLTNPPIDPTLSISNAAADAKVTGDKITELKTAINDVYQVIGSESPFDWSTLGTESHPYGFRKGYYTSTGAYNSSSYYMCTNRMFAVNGERFTVTPPSDYYTIIREYSIFDDLTSYVASYGDQTLGKPISVNTTPNHFYAVNFGRFGDASGETKSLDEDFVDTLLMDVFVSDFADVYEEIGELQNSTAHILNASMSMYASFGVCGASWDSGYFYPVAGGSSVEREDLSWGANMARRSGNTYKNFSRHSVNTRTYLSNQYCLPKLLAADPCDIYITTLGGNDAANLGMEYLGSIEDITSHTSYTDYPDTFYGNYGKIIEQILDHAPNAKIIMCMWYDSRYHDATRGAFSAAVSVIAQHYGLPRIQWADDAWYGSAFMRDGMVGNHPTAVQLSGISYAFERLYSKCVNDNYAYFKNYNGSAF